MKQAATLALAATLLASPLAAREAPGDWTTFHGQLNAQKYSPLDQIDTANVGKLKKVWELHTGDVSDGSGDTPETVWSATPIFANDTLYVGTPFYRILALDPATGKEKWHYNTDSTLKALTQPALKNRGVSYWQADNPVAGQACQKIVYIGTMDAKLHAVDADTGKPCEGFADHGVLDVNQWNKTNNRWPMSLLQPPTVVDGKLIIGWAGNDWAFETAPPGVVFAVDAQTGKLDWTVNFIPDEMRAKSGTANVWTAMSVDEDRHMVYMPVSSPSPNFWGGNRTDAIPLGTSVTAVNTDTGDIVWSRQLVHHDVWDYDTNSAPTLMDLTVGGKQVPALVQSTKMGLLFALNRETGEPIWPLNETPVPHDSKLSGEKLSATQPIPSKPEPTESLSEHPKVWWLANLISGGWCARQMDNARYDGIYTPPSPDGTGTLVFPATVGGVEWGGVAFDPKNQIAYVNHSRVVQMLKMIPTDQFEKQKAAAKDKGSYYPQTGAPYGVKLTTLLNWAGMPCWKPPFGEMSAYDMKTGDLLWKKPFGAVQRYGFYMPESWGTPTIGGPAVTAGGLIFVGASMDNKVRALDAKTGKTLWSDIVQAPAVSIPAIFEHDGKEYVAFTAGGNSILKPEVGDELAVYALPDKG